MSKKYVLHENWLNAPPIHGKQSNSRNAELQAELERIVREREEQGVYSAHEREHISQRQILTQLDMKIPVEHLDSLRRLCQLWDVRLLPQNISSHRRFIGPVIIWLKKRIYPILEFALKDSLRQQREFNAASIQTLAEIASKRG